MQAAEFGEHRKKIEGGKFVGGDGQLALLDFAEFGERHLRVGAEVEQFFGVFLQGFARVRENALARGAVEKGLAEFLLQLANSLADGGLCAEELFRGAREAAFTGNGEED